MSAENKNITNEIKFLAKSGIRLKILKELNMQPSSVKELVRKTNITYSSISSNLTKLEKNGHVIKIDNAFHLNSITKIYLKTLMDFKMSIELINEFNDLWDKHNLTPININSLRNITDLKDSKLIEATPIDIYRTHNTIKNHLNQTATIKAIFPYLHPDYPELIENTLKNGGNVDLIINRELLKEILINIDKNLRKESVKNQNLKIFSHKHEINLYLAICDTTMNLGLFKNDGSFDQNRILTSNNLKAIKWADDLFENMKESIP